MLYKLGAMHVVNPATMRSIALFEEGVMTREQIMRVNMRKLLGCDALFAMPGWRKSKGARLEVKVAKAVGIEVCEFEVFGEPL